MICLPTFSLLIEAPLDRTDVCYIAGRCLFYVLCLICGTDNATHVECGAILKSTGFTHTTCINPSKMKIHERNVGEDPLMKRRLTQEELNG